MSNLYRELGYLAMRQLAGVLDRDSPRGLDWQGLADKMNFSYEVVVSLRGSPSPTMALLERWERDAGAAASLETLISLLTSLGCVQGVHILRDEKDRRRADCIDIPDKSSSKELLAMSPQDRGPCTPCSSLDPSALSMDEIRIIRQVQVATTMDPAQLAEELANISSTDEARPSVGDMALLRSHRYDVFLSFAEEDERFAEEVRLRLVEQTGARVFVPSSGLLSDRAFHEEIADMIKENCLRTVVILSPDYLVSPWCGYEANLAFTNSPDARKNCTVPILYRQCKVPCYMSHLLYLDYPRFNTTREECERCFWGKLYKAIRHKLHSS